VLPEYQVTEKKRDKFVIMSGVVSSNKFVQNTTRRGTRETEIYFKVRSQELPQGYPKYQLCYILKG
jgi:hypothetical protein